KSLKVPLSNQVPSHVRPAAMVPSSSAVVIVGPGVVLVVPLSVVPLHGCGPVESLLSVLASVVIGPSNSVFVEPSTRRLTVTGAPSAGAAHASAAEAAATAASRWSFGIGAFPFPRGIDWLAAGGRSPGSRIPRGARSDDRSRGRHERRAPEHAAGRFAAAALGPAPLRTRQRGDHETGERAHDEIAADDVAREVPAHHEDRLRHAEREQSTGGG